MLKRLLRYFAWLYEHINNMSISKFALLQVLCSAVLRVMCIQIFGLQNMTKCYAPPHFILLLQNCVLLKLGTAM